MLKSSEFTCCTHGSTETRRNYMSYAVMSCSFLKKRSTWHSTSCFCHVRFRIVCIIKPEASFRMYCFDNTVRWTFCLRTAKLYAACIVSMSCDAFSSQLPSNVLYRVRSTCSVWFYKDWIVVPLSLHVWNYLHRRHCRHSTCTHRHGSRWNSLSFSIKVKAS